MLELRVRLERIAAYVEREGGMDACRPIALRAGGRDDAAHRAHVELASEVARVQRRKRQADAEALERRAKVARVCVVGLALLVLRE